MKPIFQETTLQFEHDIKTVWDTVVDNSQFKWRSDLEKIDVLDQNTFVETNKKGVATTFFITEKDLYRTYSFDLENDKLKGKWTGTFEKTEKGCSFTLKE